MILIRHALNKLQTIAVIAGFGLCICSTGSNSFVSIERI